MFDDLYFVYLVVVAVVLCKPTFIQFFIVLFYVFFSRGFDLYLLITAKRLAGKSISV